MFYNIVLQHIKIPIKILNLQLNQNSNDMGPASAGVSSLTIIVIIIMLVAGILNICLFVKLWKACNDIRSITEKLNQESKSTTK